MKNKTMEEALKDDIDEFVKGGCRVFEPSFTTFVFMGRRKIKDDESSESEKLIVRTKGAQA